MLLFLNADTAFWAHVGATLLLAIIAVGYVARRWAAGTLDWFEPPAILGLVYLFTFGIGGLQIYMSPELAHPVLQRQPYWVPLALFYTALGVLALMIGYSTRLGPAVRSSLPSLPFSSRLEARQVRPAVVIVLYALGLSARWYLLQMGWYGFFAFYTYKEWEGSMGAVQPLRMVESLCGMALLLALLDYFSHPRDLRRRLLAFVLLVLEVLCGVLSGMKILAVLPVACYIIVRWYKQARFPYRIALGLVLFVAILYPVVGLYRVYVAEGLRGEDPSDIILTGPEYVASRLQEGSLGGSGGVQSLRAMRAHTALVENYAVILAYLDATGAYEKGRDLVLLPLHIVVPRVLWPTKPRSDKGMWMATELWGQREEIAVSIAPTYIGSLHMQFGLASVVLGMLLTGVALRALYELYARPRNDPSLFVYIILLLELVDIEPDFTMFLSGLVKLFLITVAVRMLAFRLPRAASGPPFESARASRWGAAGWSG